MPRGRTRADQAAAEPVTDTGEAMLPIVRELLAAIPSSCTWLLPVRDGAGQIVDFRIGAAGAESRDVTGRSGTERVGALLGELYPSMIGGPLWQLYLQVSADRQPAQLSNFRYQEQRAGVVAVSVFDVSVHWACGGLLVWWQRLDEYQRRLDQTEFLGNLGWGEFDLATGRNEWSPGMYRLFERDPALGPLSRAEQTAAIVADDQPLRETAWQLLDGGIVSDLTLRVRVGDGIKALRLVADVARDAEGNPVKIYGVVQDVTAREESLSAVDRLREELRSRELSALAEHRLAGQLQQVIQPLPSDPIDLPGVQVLVRYVPAGSPVQVGGDWYHAIETADGRVVLAIGDVVGHGLASATAMAQLRYALTAWTSIGISDPGPLMSHLNGLCLRLGTTSTAVIALFDPADGSLRWARGGHLPPLHTRGGRVTALPHPQGLLLGASAAAVYPEAMVHLDSADLLLFYTDGLVERRGHDQEEILTRVVDTLSAADEGAAGAWSAVDGLLEYASPDDDTCLLAVRITP
ncbi:serine phosphatase RsbU (regulator of sigma subunit) [Allocatelliglobosispora scoriae]|uniref:Serine phosphatase RsbU (Regulator of sigma subunit) n=1 Tax=Allocatelliglobosispora scoriae TaxID=643052 RepID=A0A841BWE3_9ACTN|nr:PP2C family protein-serine/threonine phosphatase [Allocatelliglobosispora scoriae]MBB5873427.1 serine phosphatase RsbU (regulator of sigma subunit) [Allocatelliglobosispora scoriae]